MQSIGLDIIFCMAKMRSKLKGTRNRERERGRERRREGEREREGALVTSPQGERGSHQYHSLLPVCTPKQAG